MLEDLTLDLKRLAALDPLELADDDTVLALQRLDAQLDAIRCRAIAAWESKRSWWDEFASAPKWLAAKANLPVDEARRDVRLGRACRVLPHAEQAWLAGEITGRHVSALAAKRTDRTAEAMTRDEAMLVGHGRAMTFRCFVRALRYWEQRNDPDGIEADAQRQHDERSVHLSQTWQDTWRLDGTLDPVGGSIIENTLRRIERELFEVDWADARVRLGTTPTIGDLCRTPAQRRADALVEMATRARTAPKDGRRPAPLFTVLVDAPTLFGRVLELANGTVVTPGSVVPWLDQALLERAVVSTPRRVEVSETARLFTGATLRAMQIRDRTCDITGCDEPGERCQGDHIQPYALGGPTTQDNGRMACTFHNLLRNRRPHGPRRSSVLRRQRADATWWRP